MAESFACMWCKGVKKLTVPRAMEYVNHIVMLALGGYICGDHDWKDRCEMLAEADAICALAQQPKVNPDTPRS